ncbi:MAG TPA: hypothetical protein VE959_18365 [Bryobacteraceae bacterium]|nr:hypothetical protein [Bryobacteraceae bacterium]
MAIGNYWECVIPEGTDTPLQRIVGESTTLARQHFSSWRFKPDGEDLGGADFACMGFATGDIRAIVHLVKPRSVPSFYLHSAFPWLAAGASARLRLYDSVTNHFGLEGFIAAGIDNGPSVIFFDPLYALNKGKYEIGSQHNFALAALSLDLKLAAPVPVRITKDHAGVDTSRAEILVRAAQDASDYYVFQGPVRTIRKTDFLDRPFLVFRTAVVDLDGDDLAVDIYVDRARFRSRTVPTAGDMVSGTLWLQGCLEDSGA